MEGYDPRVADRIGHFTLVLSGTACAVGFRRVPAFLWIAAYVLSALGASEGMEEKAEPIAFRLAPWSRVVWRVDGSMLA